MKKRSISVLILCLFASTVALMGQATPPGAAASAQRQVRPSSGGIVQGTVKDDTGAVIPNATVTLTDQNGGTQTAQTKEDGTYVFRAVKPGAYTVSVESKGLEQDGVVAVMAAVGQPAHGDVVMKPQTLKEEVTVAETSTTQVSVDPSQNATQLVLRKEDLDALPDDPDDLAQDLQALAGPSAGPGGGQVYIDGFSSGRFPPKESIREIRINQNPFSSEYDRLGYGRIEILTKPGSDRFHGTAFYTVSDGVWNSRNPFLTVTPDFRMQNFGGNVSGPVNKHASFFLDFERRNIADNGILNAFILDPNNPGNVINDRSFTPTPQNRTSVSPRLDWQFGANNTLSVRYEYEDNHRDLWNVSGFNLPQNGYTFDNAEHTGRITDTQVLSARAVNETRFQFRREIMGNVALSDAPQINVQGAFTDGGATVNHTNQTTDRYELQNYTTLSAGKHSIKFGARIREYRLDNFTPTNFNGTFTFGCLQPVPGCTTAYSTGTPQQFKINAGNPRIRVNQFDAGPFIQDDWRVASNFTLSLGLRWEGQTNMHDKSDFAPRVGFAWSPSLSGSTGRPKTVIRGGFGMFYMRFDSDSVASAEQQNGVNQQSYLVQNPTFYPNIPPLSTLSLATNIDRQIRYVIGDQLRAPYLIQSAIGVERQLFNRTTLSVNFTNTRGVHQFRSRDINAPLPGSGIRPYGDVGHLYLYESSGLLKQSQLMVRLNTQIGKRISMFGAYIWNNAHTNTDGLTSMPVNQYDTNAEWARSTLGIEHRTFIGGSVRGPLHLQFSPFIIARSGIPYTITTGSDNNGDGIVNDRPGIASGPGDGIYLTPYGYLDANPKVGEAMLPRNYGTGPNQVSVNLRMSRTWGFGTTKVAGVVGGAGSGGYRGGRGGGGRGGRGGGGGDSLTEHRYNLTLSISARNLFNHVNYATPVGFLSSPNRFEPLGIAGGYGAEQSPTNNRRLDLQLRFQF
jgi:hypothetical protein